MYAEGKVHDRSAEVAGRGVNPFDNEIRLSVLGPLEAHRDGVDRAPRTPKLLQLLAMLVIRPGRIVHVDSIISELWPSHPPRTARTTLSTYVYHLRRCIDDAEADDSLLVTRAPGYMLRVSPDQVDVHTFGLLLQRGRDLQNRGLHAEAAEAYRQALDLSTGSPLANVPCGPTLSTYTMEVLEELRRAQHLMIEAEIAAGRHRELIGELRSLTAENPLDEALHAQLMVVLGRSGRRSDAMAVYRGLRAQLSTELGVEPCDGIQLLHRDLLSEGELH
jgi:DNA-binding SARP family transcriptional activator